jgi:hypothetical protein
MKTYKLKIEQFSLYNNEPFVVLPENAIIVTGRYCTVPFEGETNCMTQGIEIVYLIPYKKEEQIG